MSETLNRAEWPFTDFDGSIEPVIIQLSDWLASKIHGWEMELYQMVTGRYGYVLVQYVKRERFERWASGAHDYPWVAIKNAISEMNQRTDPEASPDEA